jgi:TRAP-type C4-dicarboxylate transport system substrate-binding protein
LDDEKKFVSAEGIGERRYVAVSESIQGLPDHQRKVIFNANKTATTEERELFLARVTVNAQFLKAKGMEFISIDQELRAAKDSPFIAKFSSFEAEPTDIPQLHTQIVELK